MGVAKMLNKSIILFIIFLSTIGCSKEREVFRPQNVPENAIWKGGSMGGFWFNVVEEKEYIYKIEIYHENSGELASSYFYRLQSECQGSKLSKEEIKESIMQYGDGKIYLTIISNSKNCYLEVVNGQKSNEYEEKCDSIFVLDSIIQDILLDPKIIGYSQRAIDSPYNILFPINYIGLSKEFPNNRDVEIKYYDETQISALDLKGGDILFRKIKFKNNSSEVYVTVSYIWDDGDEALESNFTYSVDLDSCLWKLEQSDYIIIN